MMTSGILALALVLAARDGKIAPELKEIPGDAKKPPTLLCEGTTDLPDGAILKVNLYFGPVIPGEEKTRTLLQVKGGRFSKDFQLFGPRERNLGGTYSIRVAFDPNLQPPALQSLPPIHADAKLEVGDALAREKEHAALRRQLADEIRAVQAVADDVQAGLAASKGKPDPKAWAALTEGWKKRLTAIERRAGALPEYGYLGLFHVVDSGLEQLREIVLNIADSAGKGLGGTVLEGRTVLDRTALQLLGELQPAALPPGEARALVEDARRILRDAPGLSGEALAAARKKYVALTFALDRHVGAAHSELLGALADGGKRLFDALEDGKEADARPVQAELLEKAGKLIEALSDPK